MAAVEDVNGAPLWQLGARALAEGFRAQRFTPLDALDACNARIDAVNGRLNALIQRAPGARSAADESTRRHRAGTPLGPLDGVPVTVKDNILTKDMPTSWGNAALAARTPQADEIAVERLRAGGAVLLGKTNVPEFTLEGYTGNAVYGVTGNPWNPALTPGGSSGGAVAGVASGMFPLAIGTDGGGSIRRPAAYAGVVGLKPTIGAVPRAASLPPLLLDFEVVGPIARTVEDLALLFDVLGGADARDRASQLPLRTQSLERCRILHVPRFGSAPVDPQIAYSVAAAASAWRELGHRVEEGELPLDLGPITRFWPKIGQISLAWMFRHDPQARDAAAPKYRDMAAAGAAIAAPALLETLHQVQQLRSACAALFERYDMVMTPSCAALPWPAEQPFPPTIDGIAVDPRGHAVFTGWVNAAGLPAIALPCAPSREGLPIGFQCIGAAGADLQLIEVARQWERAQPWAGRWPSL